MFIRFFFHVEVLHKQRTDLDLITCCIGELCTLHRNGVPWPIVYGIGINVKTGDIFPAQFTDKGPDLDIRMARTLTGGDNVGVSFIYSGTILILIFKIIFKVRDWLNVNSNSTTYITDARSL